MWYSQPDVWNVALAAVAVALSVYALVEGKRTSKRTGVIELHGAWIGVNELNPTQLIGPDVAAAAQALNVTAAVWNHDVIDKALLYQSYWTDYRNLFDVLASSTDLVPGYPRAGRDFLNPGMRKAYREMQRWEGRESGRRRRFRRRPRTEDEMAMQPMMQQDPEGRRLHERELGQLLDELRAIALRARSVVDDRADLEHVMRERTLQDILPILLGPAGERCPRCGGSGRR